MRILLLLMGRGWNALPSWIKTIDSETSSKFEIINNLYSLQDEPLVTGYARRNDNTSIEISRRGGQGHAS